MSTMHQEVGAPEALKGVSTGLTRPQALEAEAPDARGEGAMVAADGEEPTDGSRAVGQKTPLDAPAPGASAPSAPPNAPPPEGRPPWSIRPRLSLESLLKRKRSPCHSDGTH